MRTFVIAVLAATLLAGAVSAQSQVVIRTEGTEGVKPTQTAIYFGEEFDLWVQNFDNPDRLTLRGGLFQKIDGYKVSEFIGWTPESGALTLNPNVGRSTVNHDQKTFFEAGLYAPLNKKANWSLCLYDARILKRITPELAVGPVVYARWAEGADDSFSAGVAVEWKPKDTNLCFYSRVARNLIAEKNEFRLQCGIGF